MSEPRERLSAAEADRLLDGGGHHRDLRRLLDAAAAPGGAAGSRGELAARAAFVAAAVAEPPPARRPRLVAVRTAIAALAIAGTASGGVAIAAGGSAPARPEPTTTLAPGPGSDHPAEWCRVRPGHRGGHRGTLRTGLHPRVPARRRGADAPERGGRRLLPLRGRPRPGPASGDPGGPQGGEAERPGERVTGTGPLTGLSTLYCGMVKGMSWTTGAARSRMSLALTRP